ncbi:MAG: hypothetical protein AAGF10_00715 [Verrucomicrobiota bacterium]
MKTTPLILLLIALVCLNLNGQDGLPANEFATTPTGADWDAWDDINPDAWDSFESFEMERWFGRLDQQAFVVEMDYESQTVIWGTQAAQQSVRPRFKWLGPLFGGGGYTSVEGIIPFDAEFTQQLWIYGGWKYHLTPDVDIDIGGNIVLTDNQNWGPGVLTPGGSGWSDRGTVYLGFIGSFFLHPSAYFIYDFELDQKIVLLGIQEEWDLNEHFSAVPEGFFLNFQSRFGWLQANGWLGDGRTPSGQQWRNGYLYMTNNLDVIYRFEEGVYLSVGFRHAMNSDGTGPNGINGIDTGPDNMVWFGARVGYAF